MDEQNVKPAKKINIKLKKELNIKLKKELNIKYNTAAKNWIYVIGILCVLVITKAIIYGSKGISLSKWDGIYGGLTIFTVFLSLLYCHKYSHEIKSELTNNQEIFQYLRTRTGTFAFWLHIEIFLPLVICVLVHIFVDKDADKKTCDEGEKKVCCN